MVETTEERVNVPDVHSEEVDQPLPVSNLCWQTARILVPTDVSSFLWMSSQTVTLSYVGYYLGEIGIAQYTAGLIIFNMTGFSFIQGFGAVIDTLSAQAFGKNPRAPEVGETLQMALVLDIVLGAIISIFFMNCSGVMTFVFSEEVGLGVSEFLTYCPLYLLVQIISGVMSKTMYAQRIPEVVAAANFAAACVSPIANYYLTYRGIHGAALALTVTVGFCAATHILCALFLPKVIIRYAPWPSPKLRSMEAWRVFFKIGIPSVVATCAEWWAFEFQAILAGRISDLALAIHGVAMTLVNMLFSLAVGICVAASVMVGNALGANKPGQAKQFSRFIIIADLAVGALTAIVMLSFGGHIARFFSNEAHVVEGVEGIMPFVVFCHVGDSLQFCLQGIFRGAGRPKEAGIAVLATLWGVGVPASALFVLVIHTGVQGCIGGLLVGFLFEIPLLYYWITKFDWNVLARKAQHASASADSIVVIASSPIIIDDEAMARSRMQAAEEELMALSTREMEPETPTKPEPTSVTSSASVGGTHDAPLGEVEDSAALLETKAREPAPDQRPADKP